MGLFKKLLQSFNTINIIIGKTVSWLVLIMVSVVFSIVVMRYVFSTGRIWVQELVIWMHAAVFLLSAAYTLSEDSHVRVDVFFRRWNLKTQSRINLIGSVLCLCPVSLFLVFGSLDYVASSWAVKEASKDAGGLVFPFISLLKTIIPVCGAMLFFQALFISHRSIQEILND
jgi:TRAP-type mannitol/chloroaromatic compound transport system permease small subunit